MGPNGTHPALYLFTAEQTPSPGMETAGCEAAALLPDFSEIPGGKLPTLIFLLVMRTPLLSFLIRPG